MFLAVALGLQAAGIHPQFDQIRHDRIGPLLGEFQIRLRIPNVVGTTTDLDCHLWVGLQDLGNISELLMRFGSQRCLAGLKCEPIKRKPCLFVNWALRIFDKVDQFVFHAEIWDVELNTAGQLLAEKLTLPSQSVARLFRDFVGFPFPQ